MPLMNEIRDQAEHKVTQLRSTRNWAMGDKNVKYVFNLLDHLKNVQGGPLYQSISDLGLYVTYHLDGLTGLKDPKLASVLNSLVHADPSSIEESPYGAEAFQRTFKHRWYSTNPDYPHRSLTVDVEASFPQDSTTCKRVLVRMEDRPPVPIYKLECSDEEAVKGG